MNETPRFDAYRHAVPDALMPPRDDPFDAAVPPIYQTSLFLFDNYKELEDVFAGRSKKDRVIVSSPCGTSTAMPSASSKRC